MTTLEEAITNAIDYETRIRDLYREAVGGTQDPKGKKVFQALADDEQSGDASDIAFTQHEFWVDIGHPEDFQRANIEFFRDN